MWKPYLTKNYILLKLYNLIKLTLFSISTTSPYNLCEKVTEVDKHIEQVTWILYSITTKPLLCTLGVVITGYYDGYYKPTRHSSTQKRIVIKEHFELGSQTWCMLDKYDCVAYCFCSVCSYRYTLQYLILSMENIFCWTHFMFYIYKI